MMTEAQEERFWSSTMKSPSARASARPCSCDDYEIDMALSGEEALQKEEEKQYDVIIADLMMPGLSGLDLLKALEGQRTRRPRSS